MPPQGEKWWKRLDPFKGLRKAKDQADKEAARDYLIKCVNDTVDEALKTNEPVAFVINSLVSTHSKETRSVGVINPNRLHVWSRYVALALKTETEIAQLTNNRKRLDVLTRVAKAIKEKLDLAKD